MKTANSTGGANWRVTRHKRSRDTVIGVEPGTVIDPGLIFNGMANGLDALPEETRRDVIQRLAEKYAGYGWQTNRAGISAPVTDAARHYAAFNSAPTPGYRMGAYADMLRDAAEKNFPR